MKFLFLSFILLFTACSEMPKDDTPAPIDHNLRSLEIEVCGQKGYGLGGCSYSSAMSLNEKFLRFPVIEEGYYRVRSSNCNFTQKADYKESGIIEIPLSALLERRSPEVITCSFSVLMAPTNFDKSLKASFVLLNLEEFEPAKGGLFGRDFQNGVGWLQMRAGGSAATELIFNAEGAGDVLFKGCDREGEFRFNGTFGISMEKLLAGAPVESSSSCNYTLFLLFDSGRTENFIFQLSIFSRQLLSLSSPSLNFDKGKLCAESNNKMAAIAINNKYTIIGKKVCEDVGDGLAWVRMATANGRTNLIGVEKGVITWNPLIRY